MAKKAAVESRPMNLNETDLTPQINFALIDGEQSADIRFLDTTDSQPVFSKKMSIEPHNDV